MRTSEFASYSGRLNSYLGRAQTLERLAEDLENEGDLEFGFIPERLATLASEIRQVIYDTRPLRAVA